MNADWLAKADLLAGDAKLPTVVAMARELERGFQWAPALKTSYIPSAERITGCNKETITYESPTTPVEQRMDAVGITKDSGVENFGWWTSDEEIQKVITWANGFTATAFVP